MKTCLALAAIAALFIAAPVQAGGISGQYVEARTTDVWTGACFANAEMNITGKHAVMAWKIDKGQEAGVSIDGLSIVAVVEASTTLGMEQTGPAKAVLLVDAKASPAQRNALVAVAKRMGGDLTKNIVATVNTPIDMSVDTCKEGGCALVNAGIAKVETRCLHAEHAKACGNEEEFFPPLVTGAKVKAAMVTENSFKGKDFNRTWIDKERRGAYIGTFSVN